MNRTVQGAYSELRCYFRDFDPLHQREDEIFEHLGYIDVQILRPVSERERGGDSFDG